MKIRLRRRPLRALGADQSGASAILLAASLTALLGCAAFAVDTASLFLASRRLQGAADMAAVAAASDLPNANARAAQAVTDDGIPGTVTVGLATGVYTADPSLKPAARFSPGGAVNAAKVTLATRVPLFFGIATLGQRDAPISRTATATRTNLAAFSIGSRLASVDGGVANALVGALTGSNVSLSVMDYNAMANADVDLLSFVQAAHTGANVTAGSFNDVLNANIRPGDALGALADSLAGEGSTAAAAAVRTIAAAETATGPIELSQLIDLGRYGAQDQSTGPRISVQAWDLARAVLEAASSDRQLKLNLSSATGLSQLSVWLSVGDRAAGSPWLAVTDSGTPIVSTAQTRLYIDAVVGTASLGLAGVAQVRLPVYVELAAAQARLSALSCNQQAGTEQVTLDVQPSPGHASIADVAPAALANQGTPVPEAAARIVTLPLVTVSGSARIDLSNGSWTSVSFNQDDIAAHTVKTVSSAGFVSGIAASLAQQVQLNVTLLGIGLTVQGVTSSTGAALRAGAPALDQLTGSILDLLGLHLGQADARIAGVRCGQGVLVG